MTIFVSALKNLIAVELNKLSTTLQSQHQTPGHNSALALAQKDIVDKLNNKIKKFKGTNIDLDNSNEIQKLIKTYYIKLKEARNDHQKKGKGNTMIAFKTIQDKITAFYKKIESLKFDKLLNRSYQKTHPNFVYYHAIYWFGEDIFSPLAMKDDNIRNNKEAFLIKRLNALDEGLKDTDSFALQKKKTEQTLDDLDTDNSIASKDSSSYPVPGIQFFGLSFTISNIKNCISDGEGRLKTQLDRARNKVNALTEPAQELPKETTPNATNEIKPELHKEPKPEPVKEIKPELSKEPKPEPVKEIKPELHKEPTPEPVKEMKPELHKEPTPEPVKEIKPELHKEPKPEPLKEIKLELLKEPKPPLTKETLKNAKNNAPTETAPPENVWDEMSISPS